jgi:hypothetical protein
VLCVDGVDECYNHQPQWDTDIPFKLHLLSSITHRVAGHSVYFLGILLCSNYCTSALSGNLFH